MKNRGVEKADQTVEEIDQTVEKKVKPWKQKWRLPRR